MLEDAEYLHHPDRLCCVCFVQGVDGVEQGSGRTLRQECSEYGTQL